MTDPAGTYLTREDPAVLQEYSRQMALIRAFELRAAEMYTRAKIGGYCRLNLGEEATVTGLTAALRDEDYLLATFRAHGYALARGADPGHGRAAVLKLGRDVTLIGYSRAAVIALDVARKLEGDGISAEVVDLCSLRPLDRDAICASVRKTSRAAIIEDDWLSYGAGAEIAVTIGEAAFDYLDAPVRRVAAAEVPLPYAKPLELAALPDGGAVTRVIRETLRGH